MHLVRLSGTRRCSPALRYKCPLPECCFGLHKTTFVFFLLFVLGCEHAGVHAIIYLNVWFSHLHLLEGLTEGRERTSCPSGALRQLHRWPLGAALTRGVSGKPPLLTAERSSSSSPADGIAPTARKQGLPLGQRGPGRGSLAWTKRSLTSTGYGGRK